MGKTGGGIRGASNKSSAAARKREGYVRAMQSLTSKNIIRYVGNDKHIKIKFNRRGIEHVANDVLEKKIGLSKNQLSNLDSRIRNATYVKSSGLYKNRSDGIQRFYYFKDKSKNVYYNVAEEATKTKNGKVKIIAIE